MFENTAGWKEDPLSSPTTMLERMFINSASATAKEDAMLKIRTDDFFTRTVETRPRIPVEVIASIFRDASNKGLTRVETILNSWRWANDNNPFNQWQAAHVINGVRYTGRWKVRILKYFKSVYFDITPTEMDFLINASNVVAAGMDMQRTLHIQISKQSNWEHGSFEGSVSKDGKPPGACWWTTHSSSRLGLMDDENGFSVLLYDSERDYEENKEKRGRGRCWGYHIHGGAVLFNAYGESLRNIARAIAAQYNIPFTPVRLYYEYGFINAGDMDNEGRGGGVNREGLGYFVGENPPSLIQLPDFRIRNSKCSICEGKFMEDDISYYISTDGYERMSCPTCYNLMPLPCTFCGMVFDGISYNERRGMCARCYQRSDNCLVCGPTTMRLSAIWHSGEKVCDRCKLDGNFPSCSCCGKLTYTTQIKHGYIKLNLCRNDLAFLRAALNG